MSRSTATINLDPILRSLSKLEKDNLPFAESVALNESAFQAKGALIEQMPKRFKNMKSSRPLKGYRVGKANKRQSIRESSVMHLDNWMSIHEAGGTKKSSKGGNLTVPTAAITDKRSGSGVVPKRLWAKNLLGRAKQTAAAAGAQGGRGNKKPGSPKVFIMEEQGKKLIVQRKSKGAKDVTALYELKKSVKIPKRWDFHQTVLRSAKKTLAKNLQDALAKAISTSTRR